MRNPFNGAVSRVSLKPEDVDGIVFWSRDYRPMLDGLGLLSRMGYSFYCQFTIIGYPKWLDPGSPDIEAACDTARRLCEEHGPDTVVWRYDPVILMNGMEEAWHLENFESLAGRLHGAVDECVFSFLDFYAKFKTKLPAALDEHGASLIKPGPGRLAAMAGRMKAAAQEKGMELSACCEPEDTRGDVRPSSCVDARRLSRISGKALAGAPKNPSRKYCECTSAKDIGGYDTCPAGCLYCYANRSRKLAARNRGLIKESSPGLWPSTVAGH